MATINPLKRGRHLDDRAFAALWAAAATGEPVAGGHLDECAACRTRYAAFAAWLDDIREDAVAEADQAFPADRLAAQQAHIFRRLEAMEHPARVIAFPRFSGTVGAQHSSARRWIAAAAVAGLVIGLAGGQVIDLRRKVVRTPQTAQQTAGAHLTGSQPSPAEAYRRVSLTSDEAVLMEIGVEQASYAHMPEPLRALDELTPRARDYVKPR